MGGKLGDLGVLDLCDFWEVKGFFIFWLLAILLLKPGTFSPTPPRPLPNFAAYFLHPSVTWTPDRLLIST